MDSPIKEMGSKLKHSENFLVKYYLTQILKVIRPEAPEFGEDDSRYLKDKVRAKTVNRLKEVRFIKVKLPENAKEVLVFVITADGECVLPEWEKLDEPEWDRSENDVEQELDDIQDPEKRNDYTLLVTDSEEYPKTKAGKDVSISEFEADASDSSVLSVDMCVEDFDSEEDSYDKNDLKNADSDTNIKVSRCEGSAPNKTEESISDKLICSKCKITFVSKQVLDQHHCPMNERNSFVCKMCNEKFMDKNLFLRHLNVHDNKFACKTCKKSFPTADALTDHKIETFHGCKYSCEICDQHFFKLTEYRQHKKTHNPKPRSIAPLIKPIILDDSQSSNETTAIKEYNTKNSNKLSNQKCILEPVNLVKTIDKPKMFKCGKCSMTFESASLLSNHRAEENCSSLYICDRCGRKYATLRSLQNHLLVHTGERSFCCGICKFKFFTKDQLRRHLQIHKGKKFLCEHCPMKFTDHHHLKRHLQSHERNLFHRRTFMPCKFNCSCCLEKFTSPAQLMQHYESVHPLPSYKCVSCDVAEPSFREMQDHFRTLHKGSIVHCCRICGDTFSDKNKLKIHRSTHGIIVIKGGEAVISGHWCAACRAYFATQALFQEHFNTSPTCKSQKTGDAMQVDVANNVVCSDCKKSYENDVLLQIHSCVHTSDPPYCCTLCDLQLGTPLELDDHLTLHQNLCLQPDSSLLKDVAGLENCLPFLCGVCGKGFKTRKSLEIHSYIHTGEKPFQCSECNVSFNQVSALNKHVLNHKGLKSYKCSVCGKSFWVKTALLLHLQRHVESETHYPCPVCKRVFIKQSNLTNHMRRHEGEKGRLKKNFSCNQCKRTFTTKAHLIIHQMSHNNSSELNCPECGKNFTTLMWLQYHMRVHTGESPQCHICGKSFTTRQSLEGHMVNHKGESAKLKCKVCGLQSTTRKAHLTHVKLNHSEITPAVCRKCGLGFTSVENLDAHADVCSNERGAYLELTVSKNTENNTMEITEKEGSSCNSHEEETRDNSRIEGNGEIVALAGKEEFIIIEQVEGFVPIEQIQEFVPIEQVVVDQPDGTQKKILIEFISASTEK